MLFRPTTITSLSTAVLLLGLSSRVVFGHDDDKDHDDHGYDHDHDGKDHDEDCQTYTDARSLKATCNGIYTCNAGCTGFVTATNCTRSQMPNDLQPPLTTEMCSIGYGRSSATMAICINESASFTCYGPASGKVECKGCFNPNQQSPNNAVNPNNPGSPNNGGNPNNAPPNSGSNSKGGSNSAPVDNKNGPNGRRSSGSRMRIGVLFLSLGTLVSAAFL
ncbi:hypothetical protein MJO29_011442 [Puccinia striiformis f. sp. tritici]|uniref:hypothetical protein n=1 Tax=Puccinia striiformis f. sp. tritici TaxID=168172 RepID=UPI002007AF0F|nr:hypothetical protein Pst134EA_021258 [Puccinia striiformis f. sp. tritici]KAH9457380.1 hypothetical protein Pst134EA_021258 [Puccinia striiformis f. sp. tritici]KAI7946915.1 hypothetical protein MJO29_011442 [Puccinia striiformis f. sp. tritici]